MVEFECEWPSVWSEIAKCELCFIFFNVISEAVVVSLDCVIFTSFVVTQYNFAYYW